jgi:hypothetical protein
MKRGAQNLHVACCKRELSVAGRSTLWSGRLGWARPAPTLALADTEGRAGGRSFVGKAKQSSWRRVLPHHSRMPAPDAVAPNVVRR